MQLAAILNQYHDVFRAIYGSRLLPGHLRAIDAIQRCRTPESGQLLVQCGGCGHTEWRPRSCGHRSCPQCQNHDTTLWLDRQQEKLLPVDYFLATFTLPYELEIPGMGSPNPRLQPSFCVRFQHAERLWHKSQKSRRRHRHDRSPAYS